ncbi:hypothetical protein P2L35_12965 [Enterococcus faecium]|uniref:hypothetical protein n=1 Tax=Enterococcus faecium TaxID=1352 RepID=UPI0025B1CBF7|nr:hypothetical protein [Enterococcus faecium]MDN3040604.1 hypothetical protein [Enterococcus faecium]
MSKNVITISISVDGSDIAVNSFASKEAAVKFLMGKGIVRSKARPIVNAGVVPSHTVTIERTFISAQPAEGAPAKPRTSVRKPHAGSAKVAATKAPAARSVPEQASKVAPIPASPYPFPTGAAPL